MRMRVLREKLRVEIENETRVFLESLNFEIEMRVSQKSASSSDFSSHAASYQIDSMSLIPQELLRLTLCDCL